MPVLFSFDSRAFFLEQVPNDDWDEEARKELAEQRRRLREAVSAEFGITNGDQKFADFAALGRSSFSIVASHNDVVSDVRRAFVAGCYYSALVGATALGEFEAAWQLSEDTLARARRVFGDSHPRTLKAADNLAAALRLWREAELARQDASHSVDE